MTLIVQLSEADFASLSQVLARGDLQFLNAVDQDILTGVLNNGLASWQTRVTDTLDGSGEKSLSLDVDTTMHDFLFALRNTSGANSTDDSITVTLNTVHDKLNV